MGARERACDHSGDGPPRADEAADGGGTGQTSDQAEHGGQLAAEADGVDPDGAEADGAEPRRTVNPAVATGTPSAPAPEAGGAPESGGTRSESADAVPAEPATGGGATVGADGVRGGADPADQVHHGPGPRRRTRRFPLFTRSTARPEGGDRAAAGDAPAPARQWPLLSVLVLAGVGLLIVALDAFRLGTVLVGIALLAGAALRWSLPSVGMLAVRSRFTDMATYGVMGVGIVMLALMAQPDPWVNIPFLDNVVHFTVR